MNRRKIVGNRAPAARNHKIVNWDEKAYLFKTFSDADVAAMLGVSVTAATNARLVRFLDAARRWSRAQIAREAIGLLRIVAWENKRGRVSDKTLKRIEQALSEQALWDARRTKQKAPGVG